MRADLKGLLKLEIILKNTILFVCGSRVKLCP
jgi:hypothetical protein